MVPIRDGAILNHLRAMGGFNVCQELGWALEQDERVVEEVAEEVHCPDSLEGMDETLLTESGDDEAFGETLHETSR